MKSLDLKSPNESQREWVGHVKTQRVGDKCVHLWLFDDRNGSFGFSPDSTLPGGSTLAYQALTTSYTSYLSLHVSLRKRFFSMVCIIMVISVKYK